MNQDKLYGSNLLRDAISDEMSFIDMDQDIFDMDNSDFIYDEPISVEPQSNDGEYLFQNFNVDDLLIPPESITSETSDLARSIDSHLMSPISASSLSSISSAVTKSRKRLLPPLCETGIPSSGYLSSSAPTHLGFEEIWQRREPRQDFTSTESLEKAGSTSSLSTGVISQAASDFSLGETIDECNGTEQEEAILFDNEINVESSDESNFDDSSAKIASHKDVFWEYSENLKLPKGQSTKSKLKNPHSLKEVIDPVFSPDCIIQSIKHSRKARKGDSNDYTPNPKKLQSIGEQLESLRKKLTNIKQENNLKNIDGPKARKEKYNLSARVSRLKKKAKNEAHKIMLFGLKKEHELAVDSLFKVNQLIVDQLKNNSFPKENQNLTIASEKYAKNANRLIIAGQTTEFVEKVLQKTKSCEEPLADLDDLQLPNI